MSVHCTRCEGTGFLNVEQVPDGIDGFAAIYEWATANEDHNVTACDCCGNGEDEWHGEPGEHDEAQIGKDGPYAYNGGVWECW